ncbi:MAG: deoxyribose-phosphate aldolase [Alphaproteobacteria bacterium]|nr:deoxyribose-phosphate aldolase [Alphaproteobacteria bacterium]
MTDLRQYIEHTLLKQDATRKEVQKLLDEAVENGFLGVCINPCYVRFAKKYLQGQKLKVVTVVGFPLGASLPEVKAFEAQKAISDGADEIDMVINVSCIKNKDWDAIVEEIETVKKACEGKPLKVILETDLLNSIEIEQACILCVEAKADFVKTSTGFVKNGVGAKVEDVALMAKTVKPYGLKVKASGGIKDKAKALLLIEAGADRLGTSSGVLLVGN